MKYARCVAWRPYPRPRQQAHLHKHELLVVDLPLPARRQIARREYSLRNTTQRMIQTSQKPRGPLGNNVPACKQQQDECCDDAPIPTNQHKETITASFCHDLTSTICAPCRRGPSCSSCKCCLTLPFLPATRRATALTTNLASRAMRSSEKAPRRLAPGLRLPRVPLSRELTSFGPV